MHRCARSPNQNHGVGVRWGRKIPLLIVWWGFALKADDVDARDGHGANDEGRWDQVASCRMQVWGNLWGKRKKHREALKLLDNLADRGSAIVNSQAVSYWFI